MSRSRRVFVLLEGLVRFGRRLQNWRFGQSLGLHGQPIQLFDERHRVVLRQSGLGYCHLFVRFVEQFDGDFLELFGWGVVFYAWFVQPLFEKSEHPAKRR